MFFFPYLYQEEEKEEEGGPREDDLSDISRDLTPPKPPLFKRNPIPAKPALSKLCGSRNWK
jgi:hypothetical protein